MRVKKTTYATVLSIAGSDCSGGAGIQADIKTITMQGAYACSVITALTAQNTRGVHAIQAIPASFIRAQLEAVFSDLAIDAVKIGMLHNEAVISVVKDALLQFKPSHIVLDPVMVATSGCLLTESAALEALKRDLCPLATLITPNLYETGALSGLAICELDDMVTSARCLAQQYQTNVLVKGGDFSHEASDDVLYEWATQQPQWFKSSRIQTHNTHGTGCTLSSAIAAQLALGQALVPAIQAAKQYVSEAIESGKALTLGQGRGPVDHLCRF